MPNYNIKRQRQIFMLLSRMRPVEIARKLGITNATVYGYLRRGTVNATAVVGSKYKPYRPEPDESPTEARARVHRQLAAGERCRKCHSPVGGECTATRCGLTFDAFQRRTDWTSEAAI